MNVIHKSSFQEIVSWRLGTSWWGKPNIYVYSFLIDGILVDTGHPYIQTNFLKALEGETIDRIILTHHHEDHSGNVEAIKKRHDIEAYASPLCCKLMLNPPKIEPARWFTWGQNSPANLLEIDLNKTINTQSFTFEIFETPGHAADQISLFEADRGWLFSGDLFIHDYVKTFMKDENIYQQIISIKKLLELDFDALICNHQPIYKNGKKRLQNKLHFLEEFVENVNFHYSNYGNIRQTMKAINLKENHFLKAFSFGQLSAYNMISSVLHDKERSTL